MNKVLLVAPLTGVVGGIMRWTGHIVRWYACLPAGERDVELSICDFGRKSSGQLAKSRVVKAYRAVVEYRSLIRKACNAIDGFRPDVVHVTSPASFLSVKDCILIRHARRRGARTLIHYRFGRMPELLQGRGPESFLVKKVLRLADRVVVIDRRSYDALIAYGCTNVSLLPNPISGDVLSLRRNFAACRESGRILFAGHVLPTKGVKELVLACRDIPGISLTILGAVSEAYREELLSAAGERTDWLHIIGESDYPTTIREMCTASVFALPTYTEGFPNVILEAMACGIPIVACPVGAIPEMLESGDGRTFGLLVPPRDVEALKSALSRMVSDTAFAADCAAGAKAKVERDYTMDTVWRSLVRLWQDNM